MSLCLKNGFLILQTKSSTPTKQSSKVKIYAISKHNQSKDTAAVQQKNASRMSLTIKIAHAITRQKHNSSRTQSYTF